MENLNLENQPLQVVHVVTCYQNIVGVYASPEEAFTAQMNLVNKGRLAKMESVSIIYPANFKV